METVLNSLMTMTIASADQQYSTTVVLYSLTLALSWSVVLNSLTVSAEHPEKC